MVIRFLKSLFPNDFKHAIKRLFGLVAPPMKIVPPPNDLVEIYEHASPATWHCPDDSPDGTPGEPGPMLNSSLCRREYFDRPFFAYWFSLIRDHWNISLCQSTQGVLSDFQCGENVYHRKLWEFVYVTQALFERNCLEHGKRGIGFAVGTEPLPAIFARRGCRIVATDLEQNRADQLGWVASGQHCADNLDRLNQTGICPAKTFSESVSFRNVDMNAIPDDLTDFDFCWSSCAFEHLGSIENGLAFVRNSMKVLRPGGIAVHTTEYNLSSDADTIDRNPSYVLFRKSDLVRLVDELKSEGHEVWPLDLDPGDEPVDAFVDLPPYYRKKMHLKLWVAGYVSTSIGLIVRKKS